jgi:hypothetical protein
LAFSAVLLIAASSVSVFSVAILGTEDKELTADSGKGSSHSRCRFLSLWQKAAKSAA